MAILKALIANKAWVAHLLGLATLTGAELSNGSTNPILLGAVTVMTSVFHICETLKQVKTPSLRVDMTPADAPFGTPRVDAAISDLRNAGGDTRVEE